jgi:DNA-directed RNA polymerase subunit RPC12/RpoP
MTSDEIRKKQEETLNRLKIYNINRQTNIIDEPVNREHEVKCTRCGGTGIEPGPSFHGEIDDELSPMQEWLDEQDKRANERGPLVEDQIPEVKEQMSHICPYCGTMAFVGQLHGLGFCIEKVHYEH